MLPDFWPAINRSFLPDEIAEHPGEAEGVERKHRHISGPHKQGKFLPGTHVLISPPDRIRQTQPDYLLILCWNLRDEIMKQNAYIREWGGQFVVPIPSVKVYP